MNSIGKIEFPYWTVRMAAYIHVPLITPNFRQSIQFSDTTHVDVSMLHADNESENMSRERMSYACHFSLHQSRSPPCERVHLVKTNVSYSHSFAVARLWRTYSSSSLVSTSVFIRSQVTNFFTLFLLLSLLNAMHIATNLRYQ